MHILLTDVLSCPRCGPAFGLIVLADAVDSRRVREGYLGCPNCRREYPIRAGVADLRVEPGTGAEPVLAPADPDRAFRLAALLGVADRQTLVFVSGAEPALVDAASAHLPNAEIVGGSFEAPGQGVPNGMSWILHGPVLPFRDRAVQAAALVGGAVPPVEEAARIVDHGGRLVTDRGALEAGAAMAAAGLTVILEQDGVTVASRTTAR